MSKITVLIFCDELIGAKTRSGIQRVVLETSQALASRVDLAFVKWDREDGQLRYLDAADLEAVFGAGAGSVPAPDPRCHRVMYRFGDTVADPRNTWVLYPEIPYLKPGGNEAFARIISQCREYGLRTAAILYDLIPLLDEDYAAGRVEHARYAANLLRCDALLPISRYSGREFLDYFTALLGDDDPGLEALRARVFPLPLGENREDETWGRPLHGTNPGAKRTFIMVGTVEPRKQQPRVLKAFNDAAEVLPELTEVEVEVFGSLHPASSDAFRAEVMRNPRIRYHHYASDAAIEAAYARASFSVFASRHEGYGLPIVESLRRGVPCLTADFGAMAEAAQGGGCLTVDVRDDAALRQGLVRLCLDHEVASKLRREIAGRGHRSWGDYAGEMVDIFSRAIASSESVASTLRRSVTAALARRHGGATETMRSDDIQWNIRRVPSSGSGTTGSDSLADRGHGTPALLVELAGGASRLSAEDLAVASHADVLMLRDGAALHELVEAVDAAQIPAPLPHRIVVGEPTQAAEAVIAVSLGRSHARRLADIEAMYARTLARMSGVRPAAPCQLAVVISTYNRGPFVDMNVEWLLRQVDADNLPVKCVVVDNASTDDTEDRLSRFAAHPHFVYVSNPANVGMLGNLRVCAALDIAPYVWLTGDDDFIIPGALARTLAAIRENPGVPLLFHNFGVFHRDAVRSGDTPDQYIRELITLGKEPSAAGLYPVNQAAGEHDNLFTAIYPIIFRSDVLAACFNYPFDGIPFGNLIECVPTTKLILGSYRYASAYWFDAPGIAGNAHNSWSGHRPRWHLVIMPEVFDLAREAGVDARKVWQWTGAHHDLFEDAARIAVERDTPAHLALRPDLESAHRVFRRRPSIPPGFRAFDTPQPPIWCPAAAGTGEHP